MKGKVKIVLLGLVFLLLAAMFNSICFLGAKNITSIIKSRNTAVTVEAVITSSERYVDVDEGVEDEYWHANVTYTYDGVEYSGVHYDRTEKPPQIGKAVTVKIDPNKPGELLPDGIETAISAIISPVFLAGLTIGLYLGIRFFVDWVLGLRDKQNKRLAKTIALMVIGGKLVVESLVYFVHYDSLSFAVFSLIAAFCLWYFVLRKEESDQEV